MAFTHAIGDCTMPFLNELKELLQIGTDAEFAGMCKKRPPHMSNYLAGRRLPGGSVLEDCLLNATASRVFHDPPDEDTRLGRKMKKLRKEVLESATSNVFGQEIRPHCEVEPLPDSQADLPKSGGVYVLYDSAANVLYIGRATNFRSRVWRTLNRRIPVGMRFGPNMTQANPIIRDLARYMSLYEIENALLRHNIEALLIRVFINQTHNSNIVKFRTG